MNNSFGTLAVVSNDLLSDMLNKSEVVVRNDVSASLFNNILESFYENGEFIYDDCSLVAINSDKELLRRNESETENINIEDCISGNYIVNGEPIAGVFTLDRGSDELLLVNKKFVDDALRVQENMKYLADCFKGDYSNVDFNNKEKFIEAHREELTNQFRDEIIAEYLATSKRPTHLENANKKRSENCVCKTAIYLADFYSGMNTKEIAKKRGTTCGAVQSALRFNNAYDITRLMTVYSNNSELFDGVTKQEMESFLKTNLNKASYERVYNTALYLHDFCTGSSAREIAKKYDVSVAKVYHSLRIENSKDIDKLIGIYNVHKGVFDDITERHVRIFLECHLAVKTECREK